MGFPSKTTPTPFFSLLLHLFFFFTIFGLNRPTQAALDYTTLVYKGCAKQALSDPNGVYAQALTALFDSLIQQSSKGKFFKTSSGAGQTTISGLFQCRGDLSSGDCYNCVGKLPQLTDQLCGKVMAARVQLLGCYILYEVSGFAQISGMELLYKTCSPTNVAGSGFEMRRDTAFTVMENGIAGGNGFYTTSYESVYVLGQCEGDLGTADCGECVKTAVQKAQVECGSSISGQVYLHKCFISYNYYPNGVPTRSSSSSASSYTSSSGSGQNTGKTVAIIVGGTAGVGFLIICALFLRGLAKKHDDF
ncbi:Plasmodesmata-located protein 2 [Ancistrocladus abbreviatus]